MTSVGQNNQTYSFTMTADHIGIVMEALQAMPYRAVAGLIESLRGQIVSFAQAEQDAQRKAIEEAAMKNSEDIKTAKTNGAAQSSGDDHLSMLANRS